MLLSERRHETLRYIFAGKTNEEIAEIMAISPLTVKNHVREILQKLDACNRMCAVRKGLELGLLTVPASEPAPSALSPVVIIVPRTAEVEELVAREGIRISSNGEAAIGGEMVRIGTQGLRLLVHFFTHVERICSRQQLLDVGWGDDRAVEEATVGVYVRRLRALVKNIPWEIKTVRDFGYMLVEKRSLTA